jgi:hypothetical protein
MPIILISVKWLSAKCTVTVKNPYQASNRRDVMKQLVNALQLVESLIDSIFDFFEIYINIPIFLQINIKN